MAVYDIKCNHCDHVEHDVFTTIEKLKTLECSKCKKIGFEIFISQGADGTVLGYCYDNDERKK